PLADWVDYVLDRDHEALQAWVEAARFDFESFVCDDDQPARPKGPPREKQRGRPGRTPREADDEGPEAVPEAPVKAVKKSRRHDAAEADFAELPRAEPSELLKQRRAAEERFLAAEGGLDAPQRQALWPELARLNAALGHGDDAGVCWLHALWASDAPPAAW